MGSILRRIFAIGKKALKPKSIRALIFVGLKLLQAKLYRDELVRRVFWISILDKDGLLPFNTGILSKEIFNVQFPKYWNTDHKD